MYKYLLCWRYLRTRYIALASIISVTLGVATMIVVNSVMEGFACEMQNRIHGIISDIVFQSKSIEGMPDAEGLQARIRAAAGDEIEAMSPTVVIPAMLSFQCNGTQIIQPVQLIGIDAKTQGSVGDFCKYLQHPANRKAMSFDLRPDGYDIATIKRAATPSNARKWPTPAGNTAAGDAGPRRSRRVPQTDRSQRLPPPQSDAPGASNAPTADPFDGHHPRTTASPTPLTPKSSSPARAGHGHRQPAHQQGRRPFMAIARRRLKLSTSSPPAMPPKVDQRQLHDRRSLREQNERIRLEFRLRADPRVAGAARHGRPENGRPLVNCIQIKLKPGADGNAVRDKLRDGIRPDLYVIDTWRDRQGPLLQAVQMETTILNILLFFIIAVAGFGILAIFYMIVVEKTRDIGILKSLGARARA